MMAAGRGIHVNTVSVLLAKRLKQEGMEWYPRDGDIVLFRDNQFVLTEREIFNLGITALQKEYLWLPRLGDLLDWLESKGCQYQLSSSNAFLYVSPDGRVCKTFKAGTRENSAGEAVLWTLRHAEVPVMHTIYSEKKVHIPGEVTQVSR
jgi:hypothetical protein